jgi:hypothetical protein
MRTRVLRALVLLGIIGFGLAACQTGPVLNATDTLTPAAPKGVFWVDPTKDLGPISKFVLGANLFGALGVKTLDAAKNSGITFLRWPGGNWGDQNDIQPFTVDLYMSEAALMGAKPSICVRLPNSTPEQAAALVQYVNIEKKYGVKYWSIGNEPSLYESALDLKGQAWDAVSYAKRWREFAKAMKAVDPTILIYGPDIHGSFTGDPATDPKDHLGKLYLQEFLKLNGDMVDIVTVHRYPFPTCQTCSAAPTVGDLLDNTPEWDSLIPNLRRIIKETTGKDLPVGVMEYNSNYANVAGADTSPDSFFGALWLADVMGRMIRQRPEFLAYWYLTSGYGSAGHGLMTSFDLRPSYYVFQIYKRFGNHLLAATSDQLRVSVFAAKQDDGSVTVVFVNRGETAVKQPLQLEKGDKLALTEAYLFDQNTMAQAFAPPEFHNGDPVEVAGYSVLLYIFHP